jgi:hypothetical protein
MIGGDDLCSFLTLFSRFQSHHQQQQESAKWTVKSLLERNYLNKSLTRLNQLLLEHFLIRIVTVDEENVQLVYKNNESTSEEREFVTNEKVSVWIKELSDKVEQTYFDYHTQVKDIVNAGIDVVTECCDYLDESQLRLVKADPIVFTGGDLTIYEIDFMGSAKMILYPDANLFMQEHLEYIDSHTCDRDLWNGASVKCKALVSYRYECLFNILHELIHCIQTETKQTDEKAWSAEHDASRMALVLMKAVAQRESVSYLFVPGKEEEVALYVYDRVMTAHNSKVTEEYSLGYNRWRDSFGISEPVSVEAFEFANQDITVTDYFKYRVGLEAYLHELDLNRSTVKDLLDVFFKNRTGRVLDVKLEIPDHLLRCHEL